MKKKLFLTGATGFVGSHLVEAAHNLGWEIHAVVRSSSKTDDIKDYVDRFIYLNLNDVEEIKELFEENNYDYIIHAAALTKSKSEDEMVRVNSGITNNLLEAAFGTPSSLKRFVYVSSLAAIGPVSYGDLPIVEENDYKPLTVYGRSKRLSELNIIKNFKDKPISVFRPTAVYGPREKDIFILFNTLNKGFDPYIGSKPQKLSFVYVKDLVDVLIQGCEDSSTALEFYNISDGNVYSKYEMANIFKEIFNKKTLRVHLPLYIVSAVASLFEFLYKKSSKTPVLYPERLKELTAENWECNITKAKSVLGFKPQYDLKKGLTEALLWYKEHKWL